MKIAAFALFLSTVASFGGRAQASDYYDLVCLHNDTDDIINFSYEWGRDYEEAHIVPGEVYQIWWVYDFPNEGWSPALSLSFDGDMSGRTRWFNYSLDKYGAPSLDCGFYGKDYGFAYDNYGDIDLYAW